MHTFLDTVYCFDLNPLVLITSLLYRWYNSTYVLSAVSVLLTAVFRQLARTRQALDDIFGHIERAIAVLQVMDECIVARNAICIIQRALARARDVQQPMLDDETLLNPTEQDAGGTPTIRRPQAEEMMHGTVDDCVAWLDANPNSMEDYQQALFWKTWAEELDRLGT